MVVPTHPQFIHHLEAPMVTRKVRPEDIDVSEAFYGAFGKHEAEIAARLLVSYAQHCGAWLPFSKEQINEYAGHPFDFGGLLAMDFIIEKHGRYDFTDLFVDKCIAALQQRPVIFHGQQPHANHDGA